MTNISMTVMKRPVWREDARRRAALGLAFLFVGCRLDDTPRSTHERDVDLDVVAPDARPTDAAPDGIGPTDVDVRTDVDTRDPDAGGDNPAETCLVVAAAEFGADGSIALVDPLTLAVRVDVTRTHHDAVVRVVDDVLHVINREGADTIQRLDGARTFATAWERSVGAGSNPWDLIPLGDGRALVPRYNRGDLAVVDLRDGAPEFVLQTMQVPAPAEGDGRHDLLGGVVVGDAVIVAVQGLDPYPRCGPGARGHLVALDRATLAPTPLFDGAPLLPLAGCNPTQLLRLDDDTLLVGLSGNFRSLTGAALHVDDGGIEWIDLRQGRSRGMVATEGDWGNRDLLRLAPAADGGAWISLADADFGVEVHRLEIHRDDVHPTLALGAVMHAGEGTSALREHAGRLFVADRTWGASAVVVLDAQTGAVQARLDTGFPPFDFAVVPRPPGGCVGR